MLLNVGLLREGLAAARVCALERALLGVRSHVIHELGQVRREFVAQAAVLALE